MNHASSIAQPVAPENRVDNRKGPRLTATILDQGPLSPKEARVMRLVAEGLTQKQIAQRINRSLSTINTQLEHIYRKLNAHSAVHAVGIAVSKGIITLTILSLFAAAIQIDNKIIRPRTPAKSGRISARSKREKDEYGPDESGSDAADDGNYCVVAMRDFGRDCVFECRGMYVAVSAANEIG